MWTDQLWVEWATVYFEHKVLRDSSLNVGIWNLDERNLEAADGRPTVDGSPLRHFHFWGFDPRQPHLNSLYYEEARRNFERERGRALPPQPTNPVLSDLVERYTERPAQMQAARISSNALTPIRSAPAAVRSSFASARSTARRSWPPKRAVQSFLRTHSIRPESQSSSG